MKVWHLISKDIEWNLYTWYQPLLMKTCLIYWFFVDWCYLQWIIYKRFYFKVMVSILVNVIFKVFYSTFWLELQALNY